MGRRESVGLRRLSVGNKVPGKRMKTIKTRMMMANMMIMMKNWKMRIMMMTRIKRIQEHNAKIHLQNQRET
jgi:hypothetical protein